MIMHITVFDNLGPVPTSVEFSLPDSGEESFGAKMASAGYLSVHCSALQYSQALLLKNFLSVPHPVIHKTHKAV